MMASTSPPFVARRVKDQTRNVVADGVFADAADQGRLLRGALGRLLNADFSGVERRANRP